MYTIRFTGEFKRQMKMCERRGYDMELLREARYPEDKDELYNTLTPQACQEMIDETKQMTQWIKDKL